MALYRLRSSIHEQADPDWEPSEQDMAAAKATGTPPVPPTRTYVAGDLVPSESDLVAKFGPQKFELVSDEDTSRRGRRAKAKKGGTGAADELPEGLSDEEQDLLKSFRERRRLSLHGVRQPGDPTAEIAATSPSEAPGGQVSTGFPRAMQADEREYTGKTQHAMKTADLERLGVPSKDAMRSEPRDEDSPQARASAKRAEVGSGRSSATPAAEEPKAAQPREKAGGKKAAKSKAELEEMTVPELKQHAADEEIELKGAHTKDEIIKAIQKG